MRRRPARALLAPALCIAVTAAGGLVHAGDPPAPSASASASAAPGASAPAAPSAAPSASGTAPVATPQVGQNAQVSATAEALYEEGRKLLKEKKYGEACPKLAESLRIDPAVGTMLYLADCYEKNGQIASAWATFTDAISAAHNAGQGDRELKAKLRVQALGPKLVRLSLSPASLDKGIEGLELKRDGLVLGAALFGTAVPVDPGDHKIEVSAPGKKPWSGTVTVPSKAGSSIAFEVPRLEDLPPPPQPEPTVTAVATTPPPPTAPPPTATVTAPPTATMITPPPVPTVAPDSGSTRTVGLVVGAIGVAGIAVASGLGLTAKSKNDEALSKYCTPTTCSDQRGIDLTNDAKGLATGSTVSFILSGVALAVGGVLILYPSLSKPKAPPASGKAASAHLVIGPGSLSVRGRF